MRTSFIISRSVFILFLSFSFFLASCGQATTSQTASPSPTPVLDAYGKTVTIPASAPQRIVSLVPSMSEILGALQLQSKVVGVDYYTDYPSSLASVKKISDANGTYNIEQIVNLKPDLILSSGGITKDTDNQLTKLGLQVIDLPVPDLVQVIDQIKLVGSLTHAQSAAATVANTLQQQLTTVQNAVQGTTSPTTLLEVDDSTPGKPYVFGGTSFGDQLLTYAHGTNIFHSDSADGGYPQVSDEAVIAANPQYIVLTEDPAYGGNPQAVYQRTNWGGIAAVKDHHVYHINTDIMQRPGPRLGEALRCLAQVLHPDKFSDALPSYCSVSQ